MRFWKETTPTLEQKRQLTGIEKHWIEEKAKEAAALQHKAQEQRDKILARIEEIERQIGPQLAELNQLKCVAYPLPTGLQNLSNASYAMAGLLDSLLWKSRFGCV